MIEENDCGKQWTEEYLKKKRKQHRNYYGKNKDRIIAYIREWKRNNSKKVRETNNQYQNKKYKIDLRFNLNSKMSALIWHSLKGNKAGRTWKSMVDYTLEDLKNHLKKTMPKNYTWQDYMQGKLHIDHRIPTRAFVFKYPEDEEFKQCWALENLRLLSARENIMKNSNITDPILLGLLIKLGEKKEMIFGKNRNPSELTV